MEMKSITLMIAGILLLSLAVVTAHNDENPGKGNAYGKYHDEVEGEYRGLEKAQKRAWVQEKMSMEIEKARKIIERILALADKLEGKGMDATELKANLAATDELLAEAEVESKEDLKEAVRAMKEAIKEFRKGIKEDVKALTYEQRLQVHEQQEGEEGDENETEDDEEPTVIEGTGKLFVRVTGQAEVEGSGLFTITSNNGDLRVEGGNVTTEGEGDSLTLGNDFIKYKKYSTVTVDGEEIEFKVSGRLSEITAEGSGKVELAGQGIYQFDDGDEIDFRGKTIIYWNIAAPSVTPEPNATATPSPNVTTSPTPSVNATPSPNATASPSPNVTISPTPSVNATASPTPEASPSPSINATTSPTPSPTATPTPSVNATISPSPTVEPDSCTDSDGGMQFYTFGTVSGYLNGAEYSIDDECDGAILVEQGCTGNLAMNYSMNCSSGCSSGACLNST